MIVMPRRYYELERALEGLNQTNVPLVSIDSEGFFYASGTSDDKGIYYFIPKLAKLLGLTLQGSIDAFLISLILISSAISILCFFFIFKSWSPRLISWIGVFFAAFLAYGSSDVYVAGFFAVASVVPIFMLLHEKGGKFGKEMILAILFSGFIVSISHFIRYAAGLGTLFFVLTWVFLNKQIFLKQKMICCLLFLMSILITHWNVNQIYNTRDRFLNCTERLKKHPTCFPFWHLVFIGLGYLENNHNLRYKDECGIQFVQSRAPGTEYLSKEYDQILKEEVFRFMWAHPIFVIKLIAVKAGILLYKMLMCLNFGLIFSFYVKPSAKIYVPFIVAACFYMIPGLVVSPTKQYVLGALTLSAFFGIYMIGIKDRRKLVFQ